LPNIESGHPHWSNQTKLVVSLLLLALFVYFLARFHTVIPPFILAIILAYVLIPIVSTIQRKLHLARPLAILFCYLILLLAVITLPAVIVPIFSSQFTGLNVDSQRLIEVLRGFLGHQYTFFGLTFDISALFEQAIGALQGLLEPVVGQTLELVVSIISSIVWVIFIVIVSFYLIKDYEKLNIWIEEHVPLNYRADYIRVHEQIDEIWGAFFRGQLLLSLVVATIFTIIGFVVGLPFALAMGVLAGLLEFLPSIGHGIWLITATVVALFLGSTWIPIPNWAFALIIVGLHLFFQQFDLNYLIPRIIGRSVHLPPLVVILGIVTGAVLAGVMGIALAAPTIASARVLGRYIYANLFDADPFPDKAAIPLPPPNPRWWRNQLRRKKNLDRS
jgi:predicted PurR-regulated permease PerM